MGSSDPYVAYKDEGDQAPSDKLDMLTALADGWRDAMEEVSRCADALAAAQKRVREIEEEQIPEIMDELELETFTARNGLTVKIDEKVRCSIPKAKEPEAFSWLREHGHGALIKRRVSVDFGMGEDDRAEQFKNQNLEVDPELEISDKETIANPTLVKFVKEKAEAGEELPTDLFPIFRQRVAKIK